MALYSFEGPNSAPRLRSQTVVVDASYLIALSDTTDGYFSTVSPFHFVLRGSTGFLINGVVRQEFLKRIRMNLLIKAMVHRAAHAPGVQQRYRAIAGLKTKPLTELNLATKFDRIFKDHVKNGDTSLLLSHVPISIWGEVQKLEGEAGIIYRRGSEVSWDDLGSLVQLTGLAPADAMIANFALTSGLDAILTTDGDFACLAGVIDVYLPGQIARQCAAYDPAID